MARGLAMKVLGSYPDYAKSTPGYTAAIIEAFAEFDSEVQAHLANISTGVRSRYSYLPTVENVMTVAREFVAERARVADLKTRFTGEFRPYVYSGTARFIPFKKLAEAVGEAYDDLTKGFDFDALSKAYGLLHFQGREACMKFLKAKNGVSA